MSILDPQNYMMASASPVMGGMTPQQAIDAQSQQAAADDAGQTMGVPGMDPKTAIMAQRAQNAAYSPYMRAMISANNQKPQIDTSPVANWAAGLNQGLANRYRINSYNKQHAEDRAMMQQYDNMLQSSQAQQLQAQQESAQAQQAQLQHQQDYISQHYGPEAAFAFSLNPKKYGESLGTHFGELPTATPLAHATAYGTGTGQGMAHLDNVSADNYYLLHHGVDPSIVNNHTLTPQQQNMATQVTGKPMDDATSYNNQQNDSYIKQKEAQAAGFKPAQASTTLTGDQLANHKASIDLKFETAAKNADQQLKQAQIDNAGNTSDAARQKLANLQTYQTAIAQMQQMRANGQEPNPADLVQLDQLGKTAGISSSWASDYKTIMNPKAGQPLKMPQGTAPQGYITTSSGIQYNPATGHTIHPDAQPATQPTATAANHYAGTSISAAHPQPAAFWKLGDMLNDMVHGGGSIINAMPGEPTFQRGF